MMKKRSLMKYWFVWLILGSLLLLAVSNGWREEQPTAARTVNEETVVRAPTTPPPAPVPAAVAAESWPVFTPATFPNLPMSPNRLKNPGFEAGAADEATDWTAYRLGYVVATEGGRGGGRAVKLVNTAEGQSRGVYQTVMLNQTEAKAIYFSGWSKAKSLSGKKDNNYSVYLDVVYTDDTSLYAQAIQFDVGTHDWQFAERVLVPAKPIQYIRVYCFLRGAHSGDVRFDDIQLREIQAKFVTFDKMQVVTAPPTDPLYDGEELSLQTADGLRLNLNASGGVVQDLVLDGVSVYDTVHAYGSGFFVRDVANTVYKDFVHVGGKVVQQNGILKHTSTLPALKLGFSAIYTATADRITIQAQLTDMMGTERATTLYFALPILAQNWVWGDDVRTGRTITGANEFVTLRTYTGLGATGYVSKYPWAGVSGPTGGLALATPLQEPVIMRLVYNPLTHQFYAAFDLGLSPHTTHFPSQATVRLVLYRFDGTWGFRAATQGYYNRFPKAFTRRIPPNQEGIWVPFTDLSRISKVEDFGITIHEIAGVQLAKVDEKLGVLSFRYIGGPWAYWMPIRDANVDPSSYSQVMAYLNQQYQNGSAWAEATLNSGFRDENGRYRYEFTTAPWCGGEGGCATFTLNPDPDVYHNQYPRNKAQVAWTAAMREAYVTTPELDGEYIDSFTSHATEMDFSTAHFGAAHIPLTYRTGDWRVGIPELFATTEFARWLTQDVRQNLNRRVIANGMLLDWPWGADLFDFMGAETNWVYNGRFVPESDAALLYRRTLAYQRPYGLLMNTDFSQMSKSMVERYLQLCMFYGIYPSMFSEDASTNIYWNDPKLYNRDRALFQQYIPLIRKLNTAGWEPITYATVSDKSVYIERFGEWPDLYFTLLNTQDEPVTVDITMYLRPLGIPGATAQSVLTPTMVLAPLSTEIFSWSSCKFYMPIVFKK